MDYQIDRLDYTNELEFAYPASMPSFATVIYSTPSNAPTGFNGEYPNPTSASHLPRPPHIAIPTSSPSTSGAANNRLDAGAIAGIVLGAIAFVVATGAIVFYLCHRRTRKQESRGGWIDLEHENISDLDSFPPYDEVKAPELGAFALYTKYVPRTLGRLSPVSQMVPPTFDLIKEHHLSSDLSNEPRTPPARNAARKQTSPGYLNDIALTITPFDTHFDS